MFQKLFLLSIAGACGTVSRYALCEMVSRHSRLPLGTFLVNILGSFLFGFIYVWVGRKLPMNPEVRVILLTGFMGAFTTFSTFAFDTARMLKLSQYGLAAGNVLAHAALGVAALVAGVLIARSF
ncbi:MAG: fluoride efflux transporter CrcB [Armatimonadota bacterium]